ncbi:VOC family protein [Nocardiopsis trehalosi]|jgi:catechol 2,3-dioxygenase-like lactoylglutathione lyase family enzyme|uniref:VOC family protein n=1 Tax=Nocardiopsis trehalosi TaxID=109329 RepID=UPI00082AD3E8|nr:VOC family protein [Nocardiopsis trehalosi]
MTSRLSAIALDAADPRPVAEFWCAVLDWRVVEDTPEVIGIGPADGTGPGIDVCRVPDAKTVKNRLHFDLRADGTDTATELRRLLDLGAVRVDVGQDDDVTWTVLADPWGNEFCLLGTPVQDL